MTNSPPSLTTDPLPFSRKAIWYWETEPAKSTLALYKSDPSKACCPKCNGKYFNKDSNGTGNNTYAAFKCKTCKTKFHHNIFFTTILNKKIEQDTSIYEAEISSNKPFPRSYTMINTDIPTPLARKRQATSPIPSIELDTNQLSEINTSTSTISTITLVNNEEHNQLLIDNKQILLENQKLKKQVDLLKLPQKKVRFSKNKEIIQM